MGAFSPSEEVRPPIVAPHRTDPTRDVVTLVVVTWNSKDHLPALAASLPDGCAGIDAHRMVVVDNDSADGSAEAAQEWWPTCAVVRMPSNAGYAAAINAGLAHTAPEDTVVVMNPDLELGHGCIKALTDELRTTGAGIAFPRLVDPAGVTAPSIRREPSVPRVWADAVLGGRLAGRWGLSETVRAPAAYATARDVDWATGAMLAISPECRARTGAWDESFFLYSEEVDYCRRARRAGFRLRYVPEAVAEHASGPYGSDTALWRLLVRNRAVDFRRHHGPVESAAFQAGLAAGEAIRSRGNPAHRAGMRAALTRREPPAVGAAVPPATAGHERGMIWFAAQDWWYHNQAHSDFQLMREVAASRPVLVVNSLGLRLPRRGVSTSPGRRILRKVRSAAKLVRRPIPDRPGFHVVTPAILPFYGSGTGARLNAWSIRTQVRIAARMVGVTGTPDIGVTIPTAWPVVARMRRASLVFNRSDLQSAFPEADGSWVRSLEEALLRNSDRVLYVSHELMKQDTDLVGGRAFFLDHGADVRHFSIDGPVADELADVPHPRAGFFGGIDDYVVDVDLLRLAAERLPDVHFVLVGDATCSMDALTALPNVRWLGYRPYEQIPALGRAFDVALMPWLDNEWIRFANPIKLKEYLALGLPVVTTDYPELEGYRDRVWVATSREEFPDRIRQALADSGGAQERRDSVLGETWQHRAQELLGVIGGIGGRTCAE